MLLTCIFDMLLKLCYGHRTWCLSIRRLSAFACQGGALVTLVLQNSALALVMRYTHVSSKPADMYIPTTAVVMAEILKVTVALAVQSKVTSHLLVYPRPIYLRVFSTAGRSFLGSCFAGWCSLMFRGLSPLLFRQPGQANC